MINKYVKKKIENVKNISKEKIVKKRKQKARNYEKKCKIMGRRKLLRGRR